MIHGTIRYEVQPVSGSNSRGALFIDAPSFARCGPTTCRRPSSWHSSFRGYVGYDANGLPIVVFRAGNWTA